MKILIDKNKCTGCKKCIPSCPYDAIVMKGKLATIDERCTLCGACLEACPFDAIALSNQMEKIRMDVSSFKDIFVFIENSHGKIERVSLELLSKAFELAKVSKQKVAAVLIGDDVKSLSQELKKYNLNKIIIAEHEFLKNYETLRFTKVFGGIIKKYKPSIVLFGATPLGRDLAPRVANMVQTGLTADCTEFAIDKESGLLLQTRPAFGGNLMATIVCRDHRPQMATVRPGVFNIPTTSSSGKKNSVEHFEVELTQNDAQSEIIEEAIESIEHANLANAKIIVSGGRGMGEKRNFKLLYDLAKALGAEVGSSRAAVDALWIDHEHQIGQTGKTVQPDLYIACGISGAIQHLAGMSNSKYIIAINKDKEAPIHKIADLSIVGDLFDIIPKLIKTINNTKYPITNNC
ncbi:MAG: electron transfer flavoprotein subunit alpha [Pseudomonadota bacterium]